MNISQATQSSQVCSFLKIVDRLLIFWRLLFEQKHRVKRDISPHDLEPSNNNPVKKLDR